MRTTRVALIGNQNNNLFTLLRYLLDEGLKAELLLLNTEDNFFSFEADTFSPQKYKPYIKKLNWGDLNSWQSISNKEIEDSVNSYDFIIGCGTTPAFLTRIGRKLDIFVPYGADVYVLPFFQVVHPKRQVAYFYFSKFQRKGIAAATSILCDKASPEFENVLESLAIKGKRYYFSPPFIYIPEYKFVEQQNILNFPSAQILKELKHNGCTIVFQYCRQMWNTQAINKTNIFKLIVQKLKGNSLQAQMVEWNLKGNDKLIEGFAKFIKGTTKKKYKLVLVEYGIDCSESKKLIQQHNIENEVLWLPKMPRKEIMACINNSDIIVGELEYSYLTYGIVYETLMLKKTLMHYRNDELYLNEYGTLYPMLNANSVESVFSHFEQFDSNKINLNKIGLGGNSWLNIFVENNLKRIFKLIESRSSGQ